MFSIFLTQSVVSGSLYSNKNRGKLRNCLVVSQNIITFAS